jgi:hypothetical protein
MFSLFFSLMAFAAPTLTEGFTFSLDLEKKSALGRLVSIQEFELVQDVDTEVLDSQKVKTKTMQRFKAKWIPSEKNDERSLSVKYLDFQLFSKMNVPGFGHFENKQDLIKFLKNQELIYSWKKEDIKGVNGVSALRERVLDSSKDPIEKTTLGRLLQEDLMKNNAGMFLQSSYCLGEMEKKVPGDKWDSEQKNVGSVLKFQCKFLGWGQWKKQNVAKFELSISSQKQEISMPTGKKQTVETEGAGEVFWVAESGETLSRIRQKIRIFSEKGAVTQSDVVTETHHYP